MNINPTSENMDYAQREHGLCFGQRYGEARVGGPPLHYNAYDASVINDQAATVDYDKVNEIIQDITLKDSAYQLAETVETVEKLAHFHNMVLTRTCISANYSQH